MTDCFEVEIESLNLDGRGIAHRDGKTVFIDGALPGERIRYQLEKSKPCYEVGRSLTVLRPSSDRVTPHCAHFGFVQGTYGGCSLQHLSAKAQLALKQRALEDTLWQMARVRPQRMLAPIDGPTWGYRHRARLSARYVQRKQSMLVGFRERARSFVADMQSCAILPDRISNLLMPLRKLIAGLSIRDRVPQIEVAIGVQTVVLVLRVLDPPNMDDCEALLQFGRTYQISMWLQPGGLDTVAPMNSEESDILSLELSEFGVILPFSPTDFTQINHQINTALVGHAIELLKPKADDVIVDFFCGLGNFTLPLATRARCVIGLEGSDALVARAELAAHKNNLNHKTIFTACDLFKWSQEAWKALLQTISDLDGRPGRIDRVLIDPPRAGALAVVEALATTTTPLQKVVYVSCNPATLARDAAVLVHKGGLRLCAAGVVNMFPHTAHVESIAVFEPEA